MNIAANGVGAEPRSTRRPEPRWMTLADLGVIVLAVAVVMAVPTRAMWWSSLFPPPLLALVVIGGLRLTLGVGLTLALVVLFRRGGHGGPIRSAEWLALGLASLGILEAAPNLDEAVNAYYAAVGSTSLDFSQARWLLSAPAALGVVLSVAGAAFLRSGVRDGSRAASALTILLIVGGLSLWFWGPCEVARLELPSLLAPGLPSLRGWVANAAVWLTWGVLAAASARGDDRRRGSGRPWIWTESAAFADALAAALLLLAAATADAQEPAELLWLAPALVGVGLASWWISGILGVGASAPSTSV